MPIRWSALKVSEAAAMIEEYLNQAVEPLEQARIVAREALKLPNLPQYIEQDFNRIIGKIDDCLGSTQWPESSWFTKTIESIRKDIPSDAIKADQASQKYGSQQALIV